MESEKFIVCREEGQVAIIDLRQGAQVDRKAMNAEAATMNPAEKILALRSSTGGVTRIQLFNLDTKAKLNSHDMNEPLVADGELNANPTNGVSAPKSSRHLPRTLDPDQMHRLLETDGSKWHSAVMHSLSLTRQLPKN